MSSYWDDAIKGMEMEREISKWASNYVPKGEWKAKKVGRLIIACCSRCGTADPHMRPFCWECGSLMKQHIKNDKGEWEYKYPDAEFLRKYYETQERNND